MKSLKINYISKLDNIEIKDASIFFERNNTFEYLDMLNWPSQFPYKPSCQFKIARSTKSIFIHFKVVENNLRALYSVDQESVWEDSCVEFFCKLSESDSYFNFEFNCIGTCLAAKREGRNLNVQVLSEEQMDSIKRFASLGKNPFEEKIGNFEWKLTVEIPFDIIEIQKDLLPNAFWGNFYKCGDSTTSPHYLSWSYIYADNPDFHQPKFFGELYL